MLPLETPGACDEEDEAGLRQGRGSQGPTETMAGMRAVMSTQRAEQFCLMLSIHLEFGRFAHMRRVIDYAERELRAKRRAEPGNYPKPLPSEVWIAELPFGTRITNYLEKYGILKLDALLVTPPEQLQELIEGVGEGVVKQVQEVARAWLAGEIDTPSTELIDFAAPDPYDPDEQEAA